MSIKVVFKEITEYYDNGCSCCEPMETTRYSIIEVDGEISEELYYSLMDHCRDTSEQYRCLVDVSYVFSDSSLEYFEYIDWCYNLFNFEQIEDLLLKDGIEVVFLEEE